MNWSHLPVAGGLYDQSPEFIRLMYYLFSEKQKGEERRDKAEKARQRPKSRR